MTGSYTRRMMLLVTSILLLGVASSFAQNLCPGASPDDSIPDRRELQNCLDAGGTIMLKPGSSPGYIVEGTLTMTVPGTTLTSESWGRATLRAHPDLLGRVLEVTADRATIISIIIHGDKYSRTQVVQCLTSGMIGVNLRVQANNFTMTDSFSLDAMCGSGMEVEGDNLSITNNFFQNNGFAKGERFENGGWADGLTIWRCSGTVANNDLWNNTDIDLVVGGGNCVVRDNVIINNTRYGFGGIHIGWFPGGNGDHSGITYSGNTVWSELNLLSFGVMVGYHPWGWRQTLAHSGNLEANNITGAVVNLAIDGTSAGRVQANSFSGAQGNKGYPICTLSAEYTAAHFGTFDKQGGSRCVVFDDDASCYEVPPEQQCPAVRRVP